jgi:argininosuccinate lyase
VAAGVLETLEVRPERMRTALDEAMLATDLADYLVRKGVPFRQAHEVVGRAVRLAEERGVGLSKLDRDDWAGISELVGPDVREVFSWERSVEARRAPGGTALAAIEEQLAQARAVLE